MPPTNTNPNPSTAVILERLASIQADVCEIRAAQKEQGDQRVQFREEYLVKHTELAGRVAQNDRVILEHAAQIAEGKKTIKELQDNVGPLIWAGRISAGIATILGGAFLMLIYQLLTGQAQVFFTK